MRSIKKSNSAVVMVLLTSSSDHISGAEGLSLTISASKDGGDFAAISPSVQDKLYGWYRIELSSSDTDTVGDLVLHITATGADPADVIFSVVEYTLDDVGLMSSELHTIQGLNVSSPSTTTTTSWIAGDIEVVISGDGETTTTMTRQ